jgi:hypothetical protein
MGKVDSENALEMVFLTKNSKTADFCEAKYVNSLPIESGAVPDQGR